MFTVGDKISHPMHGAGIVENICERQIDNNMHSFYVVKMVYGAMTVMVPCETCDSIGVRSVLNDGEADELISGFSNVLTEENSNWNKRYRDNMLKIKSGDLQQVAEVVKNLLARDMEKGLSTGERKVLNSARQILISEIALAKDMGIDEAEDIVAAGLCPNR